MNFVLRRKIKSSLNTRSLFFMQLQRRYNCIEMHYGVQIQELLARSSVNHHGREEASLDLRKYTQQA